ncbi:MAG: dicarboxylate/amino acid:cation symporter [Bacteroidales bacterium]
MCTNKKKKNYSALYIMLGMLAGIGVGFGVVAWMPDGHKFIKDWITPFGTIFLNLLKMISIPLIFVSIFKGVSSIKDVSKFARIGIRTVILYMITTVIAISLGLFFAEVIKPGSFINENQYELIKSKSTENLTADKVTDNVQKANQVKDKSPLNFFVNMVPDNIFNSLSQNNRMLQIIFFSIIFGVAAILVGDEKSKPIMDLMSSINSLLLRIVEMIIAVSPFGVFALMADLAAKYSGNWGIFTSLGLYAVCVLIVLGIMMLMVYPIMIKFFTKIPMFKFIKKMYKVQLYAFSTCSSAATLPVNLENAQKNLGISEEASEFVLPLGTTINMDGTSAYQAVAVVFIAQVFGIHLGLGDILSILLLTTISSIGAPGIPGGSFVILTVVLNTIGIPAEGLALIFGVDRPIDMFRTAVNVTGDATVAAIIDKSI